jgi:hypothetical protein
LTYAFLLTSFPLLTASITMEIRMAKSIAAKRRAEPR